MKTSAIPERVYALCQAVKSRSMQENDLRELLEPSELGGVTKYFGYVRDAAKQLGLISVKENEISLAIDSKKINSFDAMREYIIENIDSISDGLFYAVSKAYISLGDAVFKYSSVSEKALVAYMSSTIGLPVYEDDMRAWRFWASYLGLGHRHEGIREKDKGHNMIFLPNMYQHLKAVMNIVNLKKGQEYTFTEFLAIIRPYSELALDDLNGDRKINMAMSNGLRALHDEGIIQLSHKLDSGDMWFLYETELHVVKSTVTHVTVRR